MSGTWPFLEVIQAGRFEPQGQARLYGLALGDARGPVNYQGATLFCAPALDQLDRPKLDRQFDTLSTDGFTHYRSVHTLGGISWLDRSLAPTRDNAFATVEMVKRAYRDYGLLAEHTLIGDVVVGIDSPAKREQFIRWYAEAIKGNEDKFLFVEIGNELVNNDKLSADETRYLGRLLKSLVPNVLVALTAPAMWGPEKGGMWASHRELYENSGVDVSTIHYERGWGDGGEWEYVYKPEEATVPDVRAYWNRPTCDNERKGPGASVSSDSDVVRQVMAMAFDYIAGNAAGNHHDAVGLRLGGDWDKDRLPHELAQSPTWAACAAGFRAIQSIIPAGVQNWQRTRGHWPENPINFISYRNGGNNGPFDDGGLFKALTAHGDKMTLSPMLAVKRPIEISARFWSMTLEVFDILTGEVVQRAKDKLTVNPIRQRPDGDGLLVRGTW